MADIAIYRGTKIKKKKKKASNCARIIDFSCECLLVIMMTPNYLINVYIRVDVAKTSQMLKYSLIFRHHEAHEQI